MYSIEVYITHYLLASGMGPCQVPDCNALLQAVLACLMLMLMSIMPACRSSCPPLPAGMAACTPLHAFHPSPLPTPSLRSAMCVHAMLWPPHCPAQHLSSRLTLQAPRWRCHALVAWRCRAISCAGSAEHALHACISHACRHTYSSHKHMHACHPHLTPGRCCCCCWHSFCTSPAVFFGYSFLPCCFQHAKTPLDGP